MDLEKSLERIEREIAEKTVILNNVDFQIKELHQLQQSHINSFIGLEAVKNFILKELENGNISEN